MDNLNDDLGELRAHLVDDGTLADGQRLCDGTCDTCPLDCFVSNRGYDNHDKWDEGSASDGE